MQTHDFILINGDTDSVTIGKRGGIPFSEEERKALLEEINNIMPEKINFSDDGYFKKIVVLKAKNYILLDEKGKLKKKGSSLKSSKIEKGLSEFMGAIIDCLIYDRQHELLDVYHKYIREVHQLKDIARWTSKKTITESVLNPQRTTEQKILDALDGQKVQMGDKIWVYFTEVEKEVLVPKMRKGVQVGVSTKIVKEYPLKQQQHWNSDHSVDKLIAKIYKTLLIFENVINIEQFPKYHLKSKKIKEQLQIILNSV